MNATMPTRHCLRNAFVVALFLGAATAGSLAQTTAPAATAATQHDDALRLLQVWLDGQQAYERLPSLSAAVVIGQDLVWRGSWGHADHAKAVPARPDTVYSICSISKLFTSVAVMQLVEAGKLRLDDDIAQHVPGFAIRRTDPDSGAITLRALLTHSAGLPREADAAYWTGPDFAFPASRDMLESTARLSTYLRAGDRFQYSNLGMALLGEAVASASGMPYDRYVQTRILEPLKMAETRAALPAALWGRQLAQGHGALRRDGTREALPLFDTRGLLPAAGFSSTVEDLGRFAIWQFRLLKGGGTELLRVATLREMQRVQWTDPDGKNSWGLGFGLGRDGNVNTVGHAGNCPGYLSALTMVPAEQVAVVVMMNANDNLGAGRLSAPMRRLMLKGLKLPVAPASGPRLQDYAGRYQTQPWSSETVIQPWGTGLAVLDLPSSNPAADMAVWRHVAGDSFRQVREDGSLGAEASFVRDASGRVVAFRSWSQTYPRLQP